MSLSCCIEWLLPYVPSVVDLRLPLTNVYSFIKALAWTVTPAEIPSRQLLDCLASSAYSAMWHSLNMLEDCLAHEPYLVLVSYTLVIRGHELGGQCVFIVGLLDSGRMSFNLTVCCCHCSRS